MDHWRTKCTFCM